MKLSTTETAGYAAATLRLALRVSREEFRTLETYLAEDGKSVVMIVTCDDGNFETAGFELDRTMTEDKFHQAWHQEGSPE